jgi:hypothetical protein
MQQKVDEGNKRQQQERLQEKISDFLEKSKQMNQSLLHNLHSQKQFHNPEIMQKMVHKQLNDEYGTNYPINLYTPCNHHHQFNKQSSSSSTTTEEEMYQNYRQQQKQKFNSNNTNRRK